MIAKILLAAAAVCLCPLSTSAAAAALEVAAPSTVGIAAERLEQIGSALRAEVAQGAIPGAVVAIARRGKLVYHEAFGFLDQPAGVPMPKDAIFAIASLTKPMTTVGALMLVERGRLLLEDPVAKHLPQLADRRITTASGTEPARRQPTVQDLMRHTAGFTNGIAKGGELERQYHELTAVDRPSAELIERLGRLPLHYHPGTRWDYGLGFDVVGVILEKLTDRRLADYQAENLFAPLGMVDTGYFVPAAKAARFARPFKADPVTGEPTNARLRTAPPLRDSGGNHCYSTAIDYLRFAEMLRNKGTLAGRRYLGRKSVEHMTSDQMTPDVNLESLWSRGNVHGYGFGLSVAVRRPAVGSGLLGTPGDFNWGGGSGTYFWVDPREELSVVFMAAAPGEIRNRLRQVITATVLQAIE
jgi:CubicO group peptidase (beta-lactamase class C family)